MISSGPVNDRRTQWLSQSLGQWSQQPIAQTNIVNAHGTGSTIIESGGNDVVNAGDGSATVHTGSGDVVVNLRGESNQVFGGNGNNTINILSGGYDWVSLGSGTDTIAAAPKSSGENTFILNASNASVTLAGEENSVVVHGGTDTITDNSQELRLDIGKEGGFVNLVNFLADRDGRIELLDGIDGYKSSRAVLAALQSDGHGGTLLSLGASGQIDFVGVQIGMLKESRFQVTAGGHDS